MRIIRYFALSFSILWFHTETEVFGQFIVGDTISSNATYYNLPDTVLPFVVRGSSYFDVDIDFDGFRDVRFKRTHSSSPSHMSWMQTVHSLNSVQFIILPGGTDSDTLAPGSVLDGTLNWSNATGVYLYYRFDDWIPPPNNVIHGICNKDNLYIGMRKITAIDTIYCWFLFDNSNNLKVKSCAIYKTFRFPPIHFEASVGAENQVQFAWNAPKMYEIARYDNGFTQSLFISYAPFMVASRWPVERLAAYKNKYLTKIGFYGAYANYTLKVWKGENAANLVLSQPVTDVVWYEWYETWLDSAIFIDGTEEIWFGLEITNIVDAPVWWDNATAVSGYGDKIYLNGAWINYGGHNWNLYAMIHEANYGIPYKGNVPGSLDNEPEEQSKLNLGDAAIRHCQRELAGYNIYGKKDNGSFQKLNSQTVTDTTFTWVVNQSGVWSFYATAHYADGESTPSNIGKLDIAVSIDENKQIPSVNLYPNPAKEIITLEAPFQIIGATIYNGSGCEVMKIATSGYQICIHVSELEKGLHYIKTSTVEGSFFKKFVVQ